MAKNKTLYMISNLVHVILKCPTAIIIHYADNRVTVLQFTMFYFKIPKSPPISNTIPV